MKHAFVRRLACCTVLAGLGAALVPAMASASDNKIALIPGGPHPYFAPWEQAAADAKKDFGIAAVDFKVPTDWKLNLQTELIESLAAQGYNGFGIFPGDRGRHQLDGRGTEGGSIPAGGARRLRGRTRPTCRLLPRHRRLQLRLSRHQGADQGDGRQGQRSSTLPAFSSIPTPRSASTRSRRPSPRPTAR